jgi:hypothetical protein
MRIKLIAFILLLFLVGCAFPGEQTPGGGGSTLAATTQAPSQQPSPTPGTPLAILIIPADMPAALSDLYQVSLSNLADSSGMRFQVRNSLTSVEIEQESGLKIVVAFPPDPGLASLAKAAPQVQFLGVTIPDLSPAANLSLVGSQGVPVDKQAFMAGYIAAMLSPDFRVGIITQKDTAEGILAYNAFVNGMHFYCGLCSPQFPPWYEYPVHSEIPTDTPEAQFRFFADTMKDYQVDFTYVFPSLATADMLDYMSQINLNMISQTRPNDRLASNWVVSIQPEIAPAIQVIWPDLVAGKGGLDISLPLFLKDINPDLLSEGRQNDVQQILDKLQRGEISTGVNP